MTETQAKSGSYGDLGQPGRRGGRQGRRTSDRPRGRGPGERSPPTRRAPKFTRAPGMTPAAGASRRRGRRRPATGPSASPAPRRRRRPHGRSLPGRGADAGGAGRRPPSRSVSGRPGGVDRRPPARQPRVAPGMTQPQPDAGACRRDAGRPASGGGLPPADRRRGGRRRGPGRRGGPRGPRDGQLGRVARPAPGPAAPQADRPVVGDEVRVRGVAGAVHRGDRRHLGALPGAGRDGRVRRASTRRLTDLVSAGGGQSGSGFKITAKGVIGTLGAARRWSTWCSSPRWPRSARSSTTSAPTWSAASS